MNRNILRQAQELQNKLAKAQEELANLTVEGSAGGGVVKVVITGQQKVQSVKIAPEAVDPKEVELLEDMILAAFNDAQQKSQDMAQKKLSSIAGMKIPGLM